MSSVPVEPNAVTARPSADATSVLPVLVEELAVSKVATPTGAVRVRIEVEQASAPVDTEVDVQTVETERVPRGTVVAEARAPWNEGDTLVVPVYEEIVVVERRLVLKEEVRLTRLHRRETARSEHPVRRERAVVERQQADGSWQVIDDPPPSPGAPG